MTRAQFFLMAIGAAVAALALQEPPAVRSGAFEGLAGFGPFAGNATYNRKIDLQLRITF